MVRNGSHPVASAAARLCRGRHEHSPSWESVACSECWEAALIADKEAAAEAGLPEVCEADPELVDEVAVARAVAGEPIEITVAEWQAAKRALMQRRQVSLTQARVLLARTAVVVDALGSPIEPPLLGAITAGRVASPARVVTLAATTRARRKAARREAYAAGLTQQAA